MSFAAANKRLLKEYKALLKESPEGIAAGPIDESNLFEWECLIQGPEETPFEGGVFPATLSFPKVCNVSTRQGRAEREKKDQNQSLPNYSCTNKTRKGKRKSLLQPAN